jgi:hypothetical protein
MIRGKIAVGSIGLALTLGACGDDSSPAGPSGGGTAGAAGTGTGATGGSGATGGTGGAGAQPGGSSMDPKCGQSDGGTADPCASCMTTKCKAGYDKCLGPSWQTGTFSGGKCDDYMKTMTNAQIKPSCDALVQQGNDSNCNAAYTSWKAGGLCS